MSLMSCSRALNISSLGFIMLCLVDLLSMAQHPMLWENTVPVVKVSQGHQNSTVSRVGWLTLSSATSSARVSSTDSSSLPLEARFSRESISSWVMVKIAIGLG